MKDETVPAGSKDIQVSDIKAYLTLADKGLAIEESTATSAKKARLSFNDFEAYRLTDPNNGAAYLSQLTIVLDALVADGLLEPTNKTAILDIGVKVNPKWPGLKAGHIQNAI